MAGPPRVRSEPENRPVLVPAGNKARPAAGKPLKKAEKQPPELEKKVAPVEPVVRSPKLGAVGTGRRKAVLLRSNFSMNGSCSSDASSSDSSHSRGSSGGRLVRGGVIGKKKQCVEKLGDLESEKVEKSGEEFNLVGSDRKKRCAWITSSSEPCYVVFHDEEWGVPLHDDKKLFELLSLSGALAELTWPAILNKRHIFRDVFLDFDPFSVAKLNEKKFVAPGMPANSLLSESKLRGIIENAHQICKVIIEFGSFDKYLWSFVNHKPIVSQFRYPRQVPAKTSKADVISKELVKRGFRSVGPTVIYTFMQAAGFTNDHLISCFRFQECTAGPTKDKDGNAETKAEAKTLNDTAQVVLAKSIDGLSLS